MARRWFFSLVLGLLSWGFAIAQSAAESQAFLTLAAEGSAAQVENALLAFPALADVTDEYGQTPLMYAARFNDESVIAKLYLANAELNARSGAGWTALHYAVAYNPNPGVAKALIDFGADATIRNQDGHTPLDLIPEDDTNLRAILTEAWHPGNQWPDEPAEQSVAVSTAISNPIVGTSIKLEDTVFCEIHACVLVDTNIREIANVMFLQESYQLGADKSTKIIVTRTSRGFESLPAHSDMLVDYVEIRIDGLRGELRPTIASFSQDLLQQFVGIDSPDLATVCDRQNLETEPGSYLYGRVEIYGEFILMCDWDYMEVLDISTFSYRILTHPNVQIALIAHD